MIKPDILEEAVLSTTIKHLSLMDTVRNLANHEKRDSDELRVLRDVMGELYRRLSALVRQLQVGGHSRDSLKMRASLYVFVPESLCRQAVEDSIQTEC